MSEFKFACPVCGQHMLCDASQGGSVMECPTCFQKIIAPQTPSSDSKFILTGTKLTEKKITVRGLDAPKSSAPEKGFPVVAVLLVVALLLAAGAGVLAFRGKIFSRHDVPAGQPQVSVARSPVTAVPIQRHGAIGLGTWATEAEYTNVVVTKGARVLFQSDFDSNRAGWQVRSGRWVATNGVFIQNSPADNCRAVAGDAGWTDYTISVRARKLGGKEGFLILFNVVDDTNWTWWNIGGWDNSTSAVEDCVSGRKTTLGNKVPTRIATGRWYDIRIELSGGQIRCYLDDVLVQEAVYPPAPGK